MKPDEVLTAAANLVETKGLATEKYSDDRGFCSMGAIQAVMYNDAEYQPKPHTDACYEAAVAALAEVYREQFGACCPNEPFFDSQDWHTITCCNDHHATQAEVVACMQKAAANLLTETD